MMLSFTVCNARVTSLHVTKQTGEYVKTDSQLFYHIKNVLNSMPLGAIYGPFIKKLMYKDGHMVADTQHYIRSKSIKKSTSIMIWDSHYAIRYMKDVYNTGDIVILDVEYCL